MLEITLSSSKKFKSNVFIDEKSDLTLHSQLFSPEFLKKFSQSDRDYDYTKNELGFSILIKGKLDPETLRNTGNKVFNLISKEKEVKFHGSTTELFGFLEGYLLSSYSFDRFLTKKNKLESQKVILDEKVDHEMLSELSNICKAVKWTRDVVNTPVSHLNAIDLSLEIEKLGSEAKFKVTTLNKSEIVKLKMGGLLAVNKGSIDPPTFSIAEYKPKNHRNKKPIVLVGKGVVYDTGGLSLKPTPGSMDTMKSDMAGAASIMGALYLSALQKLNLHIIALIPATDNRPGGNAYAPGDVVTMYNGKTVEVLNTDAEGRMILADALSYADQFDPEVLIDMATLTGAAVRAIGTEAHISMGNAPDRFFEILETAGNLVHERVVRFPFWEDYRKHMDSKIADIKNIGSGNAGMISAGKFLEFFTQSPYIHLDVAGPTWLDNPDSYRGHGATGSGVRLLYEFLKNY